MDIPTTQRVALVTEFGRPYTISCSYPVPRPEDLKRGECLVKLSHAGVCHSDLHVRNGDWQKDLGLLPLVGGHEGIGEIVAIGQSGTGREADSDISGEGGVKIGDRVGVKWIANVCGKCEMCWKGFESSCLLAFQKVHGYRMDGTFAQYVRSYTNYVTPIPKEISSPEAVSILCAGITVYSALKQTKATIGQWVVISGAGGGLGHLAIQYAVAMGFRVCAIDTSEEKRKLVKELGAEGWVDFKQDDDATFVAQVKKVCNGTGPAASLIAVGHPKPFELALQYLNFKGVLVGIGMPGGQAILHVPITLMIYKALTIVGTIVGNRQDAMEALDLVARGKVKCHYTSKPFDSINEIMDDLENGRISGRTVLEII